MDQAAPFPAIELSARELQDRRVTETMRRHLGAPFCAVLADQGIFELMLNADGSVWEDRAGAGMKRIGSMAPGAAMSFINAVASTLPGVVVTSANPILECELPADAPFCGARFEAAVPPVSAAPIFSIRKPASQVFTLDEYVDQGIMTPSQRDAIFAAIGRRDSILVVGGTTTGKTTLLNAVLDGIATAHPDHRLVLIEDLAELQCRIANHVRLRATDQISMQRLLKASLRLRPDQIVVGEVRDGAALSMLKSWNTGHDGGCASIHANNAAAGLVRIEQLIAEVSQSPMQPLIAEAIDVIVWIAKTPAGRRVREVLAVEGYVDGAYRLSPLSPSFLE